MNIPTIPVSEMERMAEAVANSKLFGVTNKDQALSLMLLAASENRHPASCMKEYHIIKGKPSLRSDAMLARFQQAGGSINWVERTDTKVTATFSHPQGGELTSTWTIQDAQRAGLAGSETYKKFPRAMLSARLISDSIRAVYPSVCTGLYTPEEVTEFAPAPTAAPLIAKPVFKAKVIEALPAPTPAPEEDALDEQITHESLFSMMIVDDIKESDIEAFLDSKGAKYPEFIPDYSQKLVERLCQVWDEVKAFTINNK